MKYITLFLFFIISAGNAFGQVPGGGGRPAATAVTVPAAYTGTVINYIRTWEPSLPFTDSNAVVSVSRLVSEVKQTTLYLDGLGRNLQTVSKGASAAGRDVVSPVVYDAFGREQYQYLPYVPQAGNTNDGKFKTDAFNGQRIFYQNTGLNPGAAGESIYYAQTGYEASPLNRVLKTYAQGNSWAGEGGSHPVENQYLVNTVADAVRTWDISGPLPVSSGVYPAGTLYKTVLIDENGSQTVEYKEMDGRLVLKKKQLAAVPGTDHTGWLCTYYVYDDLGNIKFVIPPLAVEKSIAAAWNLSTLANDLCFQYQYDSRNRMTVKKIPGAGAVYLIYDLRDRLVFIQDSVQRTKSPQEWFATIYDGINRPVMTAIYKSNSTPAALQASLNSAASSAVPLNYLFPITADLVAETYDGRSRYVATKTISFQGNFDSGASANYIGEIDSAATGVVSVASNYTLPGISTSDLTPLTYTFYDDYSYAGALSYQTGDLAKSDASANSYPVALPGTVNTNTRGLLTGSKVRVLDTDQWLTTSVYYDDKGRNIQTSSENALGGKEIVTNLYDFNGKLLSSYLYHTNPRSNVTPQTRVMTMIGYDVAGRLINIKKRLNDVGGQDKTIAANTYDETGQLKQKRLGATEVNTQLDSLNYSYNIRGWLQGINKAFVNAASGVVNWFGEEISYDYGFTNNQYNGNISGSKWKSNSNVIARAYGYTYDRGDRLIGAEFNQQNTSGAAWTKDQANFTVSGLSYDANGNIAAMKQVGMVGAAIATIDSLTYTYATSSNKLLAVADPSSTATAKLGDFINGTNTGNDYSYDGNGNLIVDRNKAITSITYNHLRLPVTIVITSKGRISYQYDAAGNMLKKTVTDNTGSVAKTTVTDYISGFTYKQDTLQYLAHEEGRIRPVYQTGQPVRFNYDYFEKDHLGNTRLVLTDQTDFTMYAATMETAAAAKETTLFSNVDETRAEKPAGYPEQDTAAGQNAFVAKLNAKAGGKKIGPSLVLRVMAGDTVKIHARAFYKSIGPKDNPKQHPAEEMVAGLLQAFGGHTDKDMHGTAIDDNNPLNVSFTGKDYQRLKEKDPDGLGADRPKAYLNFVLFDDQFKLVDENSGVRQVKSTTDELQELGVDQLVAAKTGFLYVYTSNEVEQDVFFDNVTVAVNGGPLLEETHYYPFGLAMAGISSNALKGLNYPENRKKYNGIEYTDELDLDIYDAQLRNLDPQIGRWNQIDPKVENMEMWSPYASNYDNPIRYNDILGDDPGDYYGTDGTYIGTDNIDDKKIYAVADGGIKSTSAAGPGITMTVLDKNKITDITAKTGVNKDVFLQMAGWAYNENLSNEMAQKASLGMLENWTKAKDTYYGFDGINNEQDALNTIYTQTGGRNSPFLSNQRSFLASSNAGRDAVSGMKSAIGAAIHVLTGGNDYSNGAVQEHGKDFFVPGWIMYKTQQKEGYKWADNGTFKGTATPSIYPAHLGTQSQSYKYVITASYGGNIYTSFSDKFKKK